MADVLSPQTAADLAAAGLLPAGMAAPVPPIPMAEVPPVAAASAPPMPGPADVAQAAMPPLAPAAAPAPLAEPAPVPTPAELLPNPPVDFAPMDAGVPADYASMQATAPSMPNISPDMQAAPATEMPSMQPDPIAEIQAADAAIEQVVTKQVAKQKQAQAVEAQQADAELEAAEQHKVDARIAEIDAQPQVRSLADIFNKGSFGDKLGAALALMAGGIAQGMLGLKSNPALDTINALVEQQANKNKLNAEEKASLRKQLYDNILLRLRKKELQTDNEYKRSQIAKNYAEIQKLRVDAENEQRKLASTKAINQLLQGDAAIPAATPEIAARNQKIETVLQHLDATDSKRAAELRERLVVAPDGSMQFARVNKDRVAEFEKNVRMPNESATALLRRIQEYAKTASSLSLQDRARMQTDLALAAGKLRIPITGPGAMTEDEYKRLLDTLGNPTKIFSIASIENMKLGAVLKNLEYDTRAGAAQIGVRWPMSKNEQLVQKLEQMGYSREQAVKAVHGKK